MLKRRAFHGDVGTLREPVKQANGFLKADAFFTRTGVFDYVQADGSVLRELRHPDEVFDKDSIDSFQMQPVTMGHPREAVTADNAARYSVGMSGQDVRKDGLDKMRGSIQITDAGAIKKMRKHNIDQISNGYFTTLDFTPGVTKNIDGIPDGLEYDCWQRDIRGNHIAIVEQGRAGPDVKARIDELRFDTEDDVQFSICEMVFDDDDFDDVDTHWAATGHATMKKDAIGFFHFIGWIAYPIIEEKGLTVTEVANALVVGENQVEGILSGQVMPTKLQLEGLSELLEVPYANLLAMMPESQVENLADERNDTMEDFEIDLAGVVFKLKGDSTAQQAVKKFISDSKAMVVDAEKATAVADTKSEELTVKLDAAEKERDEAQAKADAASDPETLRKRIDARVDLETSAKEVLGDKFVKTDADLDIRKAVVLAVHPAVTLDEKSDAYIEARFDAALDVFAESKSDKKDAPRTPTHTGVRTAAKDSAKKSDAIEEAKEATRTRNADAWKKPLAATR